MSLPYSHFRATRVKLVQSPMYYGQLDILCQVKPDSTVKKFGASVVAAIDKRRTTMESWSFTDRCINDLLEADSIYSTGSTTIQTRSPASSTPSTSPPR